MKKINVIAPVYNEAEVIADFHDSLLKALDSLKHQYAFEVIYVLDKSTDGTRDILKNICEKSQNVKVIILSKRFGHQMSLVAGMDQCDGDAVIMMDSDLEHPPEVIPRLLSEYEKNYDVVYTKRAYSKNIPFFKKLFSRLFYRLINLISYVKTDENSADFRLISNKVLKIFKEQIREQNQFLRFLFCWVGFNQIGIEYVSKQRKGGKSKYNYLRLVNFAIVGTISFSKIPLRISIIAGIILSVFSMLYGIFSLIKYLLISSAPPGWTSLIMIVSFIGGFQLISLGIMGEYIGGIFDESKRRPLYIIDEEFRSKI